MLKLRVANIRSTVDLRVSEKVMKYVIRNVLVKMSILLHVLTNTFMFCLKTDLKS